MIPAFADKLIQECFGVTKLIIYEASLLTYFNFMSLLIEFPDLDQVFMTEDI